MARKRVLYTEEEHLYCENCGNSRYNLTNFNPCDQCGEVPVDHHVTLKTWLPRLLLLIIPLVNIILCIKWGYMDRDLHPTIRNYSRVNLVYLVVTYLFALALLGVILFFFYTLSSLE